MRVIGIDPGTLVSGYGIVDCVGSKMKAVHYGAVRARGGMCYPERLVQIHRGLLEAIREFRPEVAAIERLFVGKSVQSAMRTGEGRGIAVLAAALENLEVFEYTPAEVKKSVVGAGAAHKTQVQEMVRIILGLEEIPRPQDAADALAIAICHCGRVRF
jgi:crossover junction endodeoxyribonuclease RuvC